MVKDNVRLCLQRPVKVRGGDGEGLDDVRLCLQRPVKDSTVRGGDGEGHDGDGLDWKVMILNLSNWSLILFF